MNVALSIRIDHPAYAGHFPNDPILPGVVLLDEALHAIGIYLQKDFSTCKIDTVKFLSPVRPGEVVLMELSITDSGKMRFALYSGTRKVATGVLALPADYQASHAND